MHSSIQKAKIYKEIKRYCLTSTEVTKSEISKILVYSKSNLFKTRNVNGKVR